MIGPISNVCFLNLLMSNYLIEQKITEKISCCCLVLRVDEIYANILSIIRNDSLTHDYFSAYIFSATSQQH